MSNKDILQKVANYWSKPQASPPRTRWWQSRIICQHINRNYCGIPVAGTADGDIEILRRLAQGKPYNRAVSIGCGAAHHELMLLSAGVVQTFDLYELSEERIKQARERAASLGLSDRITIKNTDVFLEKEKQTYDLVYWKDALHHMFDAKSAVRWSRNVLLDGGLFFMNDFVGPSRMQYTDRQLEMAEGARLALPEQYLRNPHNPTQLLTTRRARPALENMIEIDPSECADSDNIIPAINDIFPDAVVTPTGGVVYMLALSDVLANMDEERDEAILKTMLFADDMCTQAGETLYAVAYARR